MKKLIFTLLISLFVLNVVAQEENTNFRYEVSRGGEIRVDDHNNLYNFKVKLDTQTGKMWLLI